MKDNEIVRVFGKADNFDIEFTETADNLWLCTVPPDMTDGQYATEIYAVTSSGEFAYWTGILYMTSGVPRLVLKKCKYKLKCLPFNHELKFIYERTVST